MRLTEQCQICSKPLTLIHEYRPEGSEQSIRFYKCGHFFRFEKPKVLEIDSTAADGSAVLRKYQEDGVRFILESDGNCIIGDQMRLGKTPQSLMALKNKLEEWTPALVLVRSANLWQWVFEVKRWATINQLGVFPIVGTKSFIPPGFQIYIMSMDSLSRNSMTDKLFEFGFKLVIADEAHSFKNTDSKRSQAFVDFVKRHDQVEYEDIIKDGYRTQKLVTKKNIHKILLTGTAIKNRADEYFVPLNLVAPSIFPSLERFRRNWLIQDMKGKWSRVSPYALDDFKDKISPYVLRREKEDVYKDIPALNRMYTVITMEDERLRAAYNKVLDKMEAQFSATSKLSWINMQDNLMILRRICGLAKVDWATDYLDISLEDSPNTRYAIGMHHIDVRENLLARLGKDKCLSLSGADSAENKYHIMKKFETSAERILIINMLAGGIGMDFHYCDNILVLERQWSSADEEQFEFRFYNPDKSIKDRPTNVEYIIAKGTIDEFFHDMVLKKRKIFGETISNNWSLTNDDVSFKELVERTLSSRL